MTPNCFITQVATKDILLRVTNVCAECYEDIQEGDTIFYDMQTYRYLCHVCQEVMCDQMNAECEIVGEEKGTGLFC